MYPTIAEVLELSAKRYPEKDAVLYPRKGRRWTFAEFDERANRLANALVESGVEKGDRVSTNLYNGSEIVLTAFACAKVGAVFNPLNYRLPASDLEFILNDADSKVLVFESKTQATVETAKPDLDVETYLFIDYDAPTYAQDFQEFVASGDTATPAADVAEDDIYAFIYTSGTTGRPKGVVHEHRDMVEHNLLCISAQEYERSDVGVSVMPLYHCAELHATFFPRVHIGATNVILHDFDPETVLEAIETHDVTVLFAAPTAWNALAMTQAEAGVDVSSLRTGMYGAAPMPEEVLNRCVETLTDTYVQAYGMTEIGPCGVFLHPDDQQSKQGAAGLPALNHDMRIVEPDAPPSETVETGDIGEILLAGPCTMREYWNRPEATEQSLREADGRKWYYTGDLGYTDDDGYLYVVDRKDDMIISGGENLYPTEIENVLYKHEGTKEVAVVGEPDDEWGERVVAYVVGDATADQLDQFLTDSDELANFKRPREYYFVETLPKTASGKIKKFELRDEESPLG